MTEEQIKTLCKMVVDNSSRPLTESEKELIKQAIDVAKTPQEMLEAVIAILSSFNS
ncbi:MAG: hypothetical protein ACI4MS_08100 [Candidatus Coproplasma sp.]